jgi:hypothetical protein
MMVAGRKLDPNSKAGKVRTYIEANPEAKADAIAAATGVDIKYVRTVLNPPKKAKAKKAAPKVAPKTEDNKDKGRIEDAAADMMNHPLFPIFLQALEQVMYGKGERHGGKTIPFMRQPWLHYANMHGSGFLTGQAAKKLEEAVTTKKGEALEQELLGAIVYTGMAILKNQMDVTRV